jgi:O-phosphoseryl-tRNA(Cys) synthetase
MCIYDDLVLLSQKLHIQNHTTITAIPELLPQLPVQRPLTLMKGLLSHATEAWIVLLFI